MEDGMVVECCERMIALRHARVRRMLLRRGLHLGQPEMLSFVQANPGCSQKQMADSAGVTPASIAASFKRMESAGLILRRADTADARCNRVYITEKGERELALCQQEISRVNAAMLRGITPQELSVLEACIEKISRNLREKSENEVLTNL